MPLRPTAPDNPRFSARPASRYTLAQLTAFYNQTRADYLVPMDMTVADLERYIQHYDVDLDASCVALNDAGEVAGLGMLGIRQGRGWVTRLGVLPVKRRSGAGQFILTQLLTAARDRELHQVQLEVIKGNTPAHALFLKNGFSVTRELLVIRRPPGLPDENPSWEAVEWRALSAAEIETRLKTRPPGAAWTEETASLLNAGQLQGLTGHLPTRETGWLVYRASNDQHEHLVLSATAQNIPQLGMALLYHLHRQTPDQPMLVENVPLDGPTWPLYQALSYTEAFRRREMVKPLD